MSDERVSILDEQAEDNDQVRPSTPEADGHHHHHYHDPRAALNGPATNSSAAAGAQQDLRDTDRAYHRARLQDAARATEAQRRETSRNETAVSTGRDFNDRDFNDAAPTKTGASRTRLIAIGGIAVVVLLLLLALGIVPRLRQGRELAAAERETENTLPAVNVARPEQPSATNELVLPGTTQGIQEIVVSARTGGYVSRYLVDIGDRVRTGQLLAEIEVPELDQQLQQAQQELAEAEQQVAQARQGLSQAQATLQQAQAGLGQSRTNAELSRVTLTRSRNLVRQGVVSRQETDERQAEYDARQADVEVALANIRDRQANIGAQQAIINARLAGVEAQRANVRRFVELQSFKRITAPFDGVVTARNIDTGSLISGSGGAVGTNNPTGGGNGGSSGAQGATGGAGGNGTSNSGGLFRVARISSIRAYVQVPQTYMSAITPGLQAEVMVKEMPQTTFNGRVVRTASALDAQSRTLLVEVLVGNESRQLLPGMYTQVKFTLNRTTDVVLIPGSSLVVRADGTQVIVARPDGTVHYQQIETGRDYGKQIEVVSGLSADQQVVTNPTDALQEGARVEVRQVPPSSSPPQQGQQSAPASGSGGAQPPNTPQGGQAGGAPQQPQR